MNKYYYELMEYMKTIKAISTHSHRLPDQVFVEGFCLKTLLQNSYSEWWCGVHIGDTDDSRREFFDQVKNRNFLKSVERGLQKLYKIGLPLRAETYHIFDNAIKKAHKEDGEFHLKILSKTAGYERILHFYSENKIKPLQRPFFGRYRGFFVS